MKKLKDIVNGLQIEIKPPKDTEFKECDKCKMPFVYDGTLTNCLWCEIHKDEHEG